MDKRIGNKQGSEVTWPEKTISNLPYNKPCNTMGIGNGYFVVVDVFPLPGYLSEVEKLRGQVRAMSDAPKRTSTKS